MDAAYTSRAMPPLPAVRTDLTPQKQSVTTDLPQEKSVAMLRDSQPGLMEGDTRSRNAAMSATAGRLAAENRRQLAREVQVEVDEATSDFVYKTVNPETGDVIAQFPNETLMKIRAYVREDAATVSEAVERPGQDPAAETTPHIERFI